MGNQFRRDVSRGWVPSADAGNAPNNSLLRADNLVLSEDGAATLRRGSRKISERLPVGFREINALHSNRWGGEKYIGIGANDAAYGLVGEKRADITLEPIASGFDGSGDIAIGSMMKQMFFARGKTKKKWDGTTGRTWGIPPIQLQPTLTAVNLVTKVFHDFETHTEWAAVSSEGTVADSASGGVDGNDAVQVTPAANGRFRVQHTYAGETDYFDFDGANGGDSDVIKLAFFDGKPESFKRLKIDISCNGDTTDPFDTDYFTYEWNVNDSSAPIGLSRLETIDSVRKQSRTGESEDAAGSAGPEEYRITPDGQIMDWLTDRVQERDALDRSVRPPGWKDGWFFLAIPRGRMQRVGATNGKGWHTIKALQITYESDPASTTACRLDNFDITAGSEGRVLSGTYLLRLVAAYNSGEYVEVSKPGAASEPIVLTAQGLQVEIPCASMAQIDYNEVNEIWPYLYNPLIGGYYRAPRPVSLTRTKHRINEFGPFPDGTLDADDRRWQSMFGLNPGLLYPQSNWLSCTAASETVTTGDASAMLTLRPTDSSNHGPSCNWLTVGAASLHEAVDEETADNNTTYITQRSDEPGGCGSTAAFQYCKMQYDNATGVVPSGATIDKVTLTLKYYAFDSHTFINFGLNGGDGSESPALNAWTTWTSEYTTNPSTSSAWTIEDLDDMYTYIGYRSWLGGTHYIRVTQVYVDIEYTATSETVGSSAASPGLKFLLMTSEVELLLNNQILDLSKTLPPDNIIHIGTPYNGRLPVLTEDFLYLSDRNNPGNFKSTHAIRLIGEEAYWTAVVSGGLILATSSDFYRIEGTLGQLASGVLDMTARKLNVSSPAVDQAFGQEGNIIVYRAADGIRIFNGERTVPLRGDTRLLWNGKTRHGVGPVDKFGRFRIAIGNDMLSTLTPEGVRASTLKINEFGAIDSALPQPQRLGQITFGFFKDAAGMQSNVLHRFEQELERWYRHTYTPSFRTLKRDCDGGIIAGGLDGYVWELDYGTQDDGSDIPVVMWTPMEDNDQPLQRKDPLDTQLMLDTGGNAATVAYHLDDSETADAASITPTTSGVLPYKADITAVAAHRRLQMRLTGSFSTFKLREYSVGYRERPPHRMAIDSGYLNFGHDALVWLRQVRIKLRSDSNITVKVYFEDVLTDTQTITVTAGIMDIYTVKYGRAIKGRQMRLLFQTTASASGNEVGFEPEWFSVRLRPTGNKTQKQQIRMSLIEGA